MGFINRIRGSKIMTDVRPTDSQGGFFDLPHSVLLLSQSYRSCYYGHPNYYQIFTIWVSMLEFYCLKFWLDSLIFLVWLCFIFPFHCLAFDWMSGTNSISYICWIIAYAAFNSPGNLITGNQWCTESWCHRIFYCKISCSKMSQDMSYLFTAELVRHWSVV